MRPPVPRRDLASLHKYNFSNTSITKTFHFFEKKKKRFYLYEINWIFSCGNVSFTFPHTHVLCSMYLSMSYFIYLLGVRIDSFLHNNCPIQSLIRRINIFGSSISLITLLSVYCILVCWSAGRSTGRMVTIS